MQWAGEGLSVQGRESLSRWSLSRGLCPGRGSLSERPPPPYIKERAVCILLEYILVMESFSVIPVTDFDENPCISMSKNSMFCELQQDSTQYP